jgi:hypothetical protein
MYQGSILSESLADPTLLNNYAHIYVKVQKHPESIEHPFWHMFKVSISDDEIDAATREYAAQLKSGWYAHFWSHDTVYVVLRERVFVMPRESTWQSKAYLKAKKYAVEQGIDERYLDLWIED